MQGYSALQRIAAHCSSLLEDAGKSTGRRRRLRQIAICFQSASNGTAPSAMGVQVQMHFPSCTLSMPRTPHTHSTMMRCCVSRGRVLSRNKNTKTVEYYVSDVEVVRPGIYRYISNRKAHSWLFSPRHRRTVALPACLSVRPSVCLAVSGCLPSPVRLADRPSVLAHSLACFPFFPLPALPTPHRHYRRSSPSPTRHLPRHDKQCWLALLLLKRRLPCHHTLTPTNNQTPISTTETNTAAAR